MNNQLREVIEELLKSVTLLEGTDKNHPSYSKRLFHFRKCISKYIEMEGHVPIDIANSKTIKLACESLLADYPIDLEAKLYFET